jgi:hypothetical protein
LVGGLNILIRDTLGYSGVEVASCSFVGGLNIVITDALEYTDSQAVTCPVIGRFKITIFISFDEFAMAFLQVMDC